ncbi:MAG: hotdog fold thioesterase [Amphiplicatus sp.]
MTRNDFMPAETDIGALNEWMRNTASDALGIRITDASADYLKAEMPVDDRHVQARGVLHGGVSCVLSETIGSVLSNIAAAKDGKQSVGVEINANHMKAVRKGETIVGECRFLHRGRTLHVLQIEIKNAQGGLACVSRLTMAVLESPS